MGWITWPTIATGQAFQLFQEHSTHLRKKREQEQAKRQAPVVAQNERKGRTRELLHAITVSPRDPLLDYKRPRLVQLLHEAEASRDEAKKQAQAVAKKNGSNKHRHNALK